MLWICSDAAPSHLIVRFVCVVIGSLLGVRTETHSYFKNYLLSQPWKFCLSFFYSASFYIPWDYSKAFKAIFQFIFPMYISRWVLFYFLVIPLAEFSDWLWEEFTSHYFSFLVVYTIIPRNATGGRRKSDPLLEVREYCIAIRVSRRKEVEEKETSRSILDLIFRVSSRAAL